LKVLRGRLVHEDKLVTAPEEGFYRFAVDVNFTSSSAAASIVGARSASGPQEWRPQGVNAPPSKSARVQAGSNE
jgi:hypothetical protein